MKRALLLSLAGLLVLSSGCRRHGTDYTSSGNTGDVSLVVSETIAESEMISSAENVFSESCANVAQGSSAESYVGKPDKTVSQVREQPKTSSVAPPNTNTVQTPPEIKPETPANATEADTKAVADRVIYHLNSSRVNIGVW